MDSNYRESQPDIRVQIDRQRAADLGVSVEDIGRTLELMFGETEVSTFVSRGDEYPVIMRARPEDRASPNDLTNTFIRAGNGELVPLSSFVTLTESAAPQALNRFDRLRSITIQSSLTPGVSIGEGLEILQQIVRDNLPAEVRIGYTGQSQGLPGLDRRDLRDLRAWRCWWCSWCWRRSSKAGSTRSSSCSPCRSR